MITSKNMTSLLYKLFYMLTLSEPWVKFLHVDHNWNVSTQGFQVPDRDIVHRNLSRRYQMPYKLLCEGKDDEIVVRAILNRLRRDIQQSGNVLLRLAECLATRLDTFSKSGMKIEDVGTILDYEVDQFRDYLTRNDAELLLKAAKSRLGDVRYGREVRGHSNFEVIFRYYVIGKYRADFEDRIPLTQKHHKYLSNDVLQARLSSICTKVMETIEVWAKQSCATNNIKKIRLPRRKKIERISLEDNLL
jgi:hypothetical protein